MIFLHNDASVGPSCNITLSRNNQSFWDYGLTLMMAAISFLITERSRVNLHICKRNNRVTMTLKPHILMAEPFCWCNFGRSVTAAHHKVSATTEHFGRDATVGTAGVFGIQDITAERNKNTQRRHSAARCESLMRTL